MPSRCGKRYVGDSPVRDEARPQETLRILHLVDHLAVHGKSTLLCDLVAHGGAELEHCVLSVKFGGPRRAPLEKLGAKVEVLDAKGVGEEIASRRKILNHIRVFRPSVVVCWSGRTNLLAALLTSAGVPVIWTLHNVYVRMASLKDRLALRVSAYLSSRVPARIVCCSDAVAKVYETAHKYDRRKLTVIPNGTDTTRFQPDRERRLALRRELGIDECAMVVTIAGAFRRIVDKDFASFVSAAGKVCEKHPAVHFLMCGYGLTWSNRVLVEWIERAKLGNRIDLLGVRDDLHTLFSATDIVASSSLFEAFGLTIIEGMAAGAIPVCTDTGEMGRAARGIGRVVPPGEPQRLADAIGEIVTMSEGERKMRSAAAVRRAGERYDIVRTAALYASLFREIAASFHGSR